MVISNKDINLGIKHTPKSLYVSVAIPTYKRSTYLLDALKSVIIQQTDFLYEILVLDNACDHNLQAEVEKIALQTTISIRYIPVLELGLHNGRNKAALEGKGEIIVYIDDDVIAHQGWLSSLCVPFQDPTVGGVGGKSIPKWEGKRPEWLDFLHPSYFSILDLGNETKQMHFPDTPYGCNMAFRRSLVLELGGFAPDGMGGGKIEWQRGDGETGFAYKVYAKNYKIIYTNEGHLYHRIPGQRMTLSFVRSRSMKGAISGFYTQQRTHHYRSSVLVFKGLKSICKFVFFSISELTLRFLPIQAWIKYDIQAIHHFITGLYQLRLAFDGQLRKWVERENYWQSQ